MRRSGSPPDDTTRLVSILALLPVPRFALEIGCGVYPASQCCATIGSRWIALDPYLPSLHEARQRGPQVWLIQADGCALPLNASFDLILIRHPDLDRASDSWHYILKSASQWLSPGGMLAVTLYSYAERDQVRAWLNPLSLRCEFPPERDLCPPGLAGRDRFVVLANAR
jgi:hypothetical protein